MLLSTLIDSLQVTHSELQVQIDALQAKQREIQLEMQGTQARESRMESCLALLQEAIRESADRPEELRIFQEAVMASFAPESVTDVPIARLLPVEKPTDLPQDEPIEPAPQDPDVVVDVEAQGVTESDVRPDKASFGELLRLQHGQLRAIARAHNLNSKGTKADLAARLEGKVTTAEFDELHYGTS